MGMKHEMLNVPPSKPRPTWYDEDKVDEVALAMFWLTAFQEHKDELWRAWKGTDWDVLNRLEARGMIRNSRKAKSIALTEEGRRRSEELFQKMFGSPKSATLPPRPTGKSVEEENGE